MLESHEFHYESVLVTSSRTRMCFFNLYDQNTKATLKEEVYICFFKSLLLIHSFLGIAFINSPFKLDKLLNINVPLQISLVLDNMSCQHYMTLY